MNLKQKVSLGLSSIIIVIMVVTAIIVSIVITSQNRTISFDMILSSFNFIEEIIQDDMDALALSTAQLAGGTNMGEKIRFLSENRETLGYLTVREMYEGVTKSVYQSGIIAGIWKAAIYDSTQDLVSFAHFSDSATSFGYVHLRPAFICKMASVTKGADINFFSDIWTEVKIPPQDFDLKLNPAYVEKLGVQFEILDGSLCLVAYSPIMANIYDSEAGGFRQKRWGTVKLAKRLDDAFIQRVARLTGSSLNIYLDRRLCEGNLDQYESLELKEDRSALSTTKKNKTIFLSETLVSGTDYFQGVLPVNLDGHHQASFAVLHSKETAKKNAWQMIGMLSFVTLTVLIVLLPLSLFLVTKLFINPIIEFTSITSKIALGDLDKQIDTGKKDEFGILARSFSKMQDSIKNRILALEKAEEKYRNLFEFAPDGICISTRTGDILSFNDAFFAMAETESKQDIVKRNVKDFYQYPQIRERMLETLFQERVIKNFEIEFKTLKGNLWPAYISLQIIQYGNVAAILAIIRNMSEYKKARQELSRLRNLLSNIIDSMPSMMICVDQDFNISLMNSEAEKQLNIESPAAAGKPIHTLYPAFSDKLEKIQSALTHRVPYKISKERRVEGDEIRYFSTTIYPLTGGKETGAVIRVDDITDQVRLEEIIVQSEKMVSLGGLAAGMAHEINNPLAGILQNAYVLRNRLSDPLPANLKIAQESGFSMDQLRSYLEKRELFNIMDSIADSGKRAADIVKNMLSFARMELSDFSEFHLDELLDSTVELAGADYNLKKKYDFRLIRIERQYETNLPMVMCSKSKLQQAFFNILQNAAQAMCLEGTWDGNPPALVLKITREADGVAISIKDNGPGMTEKVRKRIFEPFFTTKSAGTGTGLGMSISYFIITENHKGTLSVRSMPGQGAEFIITLPVRQSTALKKKQTV